jgi:hypothetical protein
MGLTGVDGPIAGVRRENLAWDGKSGLKTVAF